MTRLEKTKILHTFVWFWVCEKLCSINSYIRFTHAIWPDGVSALSGFLMGNQACWPCRRFNRFVKLLDDNFPPFYFKVNACVFQYR